MVVECEPKAAKLASGEWRVSMRLPDWKSQHALRGVSWINVLRNVRIADVGIARIRGHSVLIPVDDADGAVLVWQFDSTPGAIPILFVRLTEDEANAVYAADPYTVGVLEPIRRHIANPWAVLAVERGGAVDVRPFQINKRVSEDAFVADLDATAAESPALNAGDRRTKVPEADMFAQLARDLAFA